MNIHFIKSAEKKEILARLNDQFGIEDLDYLFLQFGKEKIRAYSGSLSKEEIMKMSEYARIEIIGLYVMKEEGDYRLTIDAAHHFKDKITKNILELSEEQFQKWIRGHNIEMPAERGTYIIKYKDDLIGTGKSNGQVLFNFIPKDRRLRK